MISTLITGPCSLENYELSHKVLSEIYPLVKDKDFYFKGSFDKANRSSITGNRGPGIDEGIDIFSQLKKDFPNVKFTTDVHEINQVERLRDVVDLVQVPAFLCRQTDLIVECAKHFDYVNIKKGQWISPLNMVQGIDKVKNINPSSQVWVTERGTVFGYSQLMVDFSSVDFLKQHFDKVIFDVTHSAQLVKENGRIGGNPQLAQKYFKVAETFGYDGIFVETHPNPKEAVSDGDSMIDLETIKLLLK